MSGMCMDHANLDPEMDQKVHQLEDELGVELMAVEAGCEWANLDPGQLERLKNMEKDTGVILLAYNKK